ncbi:putative endoglucanase [Stanieria sp. NIES-3757]|nr:putative endoglucanase [Stanieria sp. NIES-3757]
MLKDINFEIVQDWDGGFKAEVDFSSTDKITNGWQLQFEAPFEIKEIYGAEVVKTENNQYTVGNLDWNEKISTDQSQQIIIIANDYGQLAQPATNFQLLVDEQSNQNLVEPIPPEEPQGTDKPIEQPPITNPEPIPDGNPEGTGKFRYGEALQKSFLFYEANRSGDLPNDKRIEWRGDSALGDGSDVGRDLTGGYYDAGDHVKFGFPMANSMTTLAWGVDEYKQGYQVSGQLDEAIEAIKWGTDFFLKAHVTEDGKTKEFYGQVGNGWDDHAYWGSPETMNMFRPSHKIDASHPGSDLAGETAASLASASILFRGVDDAYADKLLENAKQLYEFADTYRGKYSDSITDAQSFYNSSGYGDELAWGASWLYKATDDKSYLDKAQSYYDHFMGGLGTFTYNWDDKSYGVAVLLAQETGSDRYKSAVEGYLDIWLNGQYGVQYTSGGLAWRGEWGSLRMAANTAFLAGVYSDTVNDGGGRFSAFSEKQINYMLGDNPRNSSYMVGFGDNYSKNPHHRSSHGGGWSEFHNNTLNQHLLYGALVGGPGSTDDFSYQDLVTDYKANEVATDYNAAFTGVLARMYEMYGGDALSNAELDALPGIDIVEV